MSTRCWERHLPLDLPSLSLLVDIGARFGGVSKLQPRYEIHRDKPQWHTLIYTVAGEGWLQTGGRQHRLTPGTLWIGPASLEHHYGIRRAPWQIAWICLDTENRLRFAPSKPVVSHSRSVTEMDHVFRQILTEADTKKPDHDLMLEGYARLVHLLLKRDILACRLAPVDSRQLAFEQLVREIRNNPNQRWTVETLRRHSGLPVAADRFGQLCKQFLGRTPSALVRSVRMEAARELLAATDYCIYLIAGMVGYENEYAFSAAFHRETGLSPRQFRARYHSDRGNRKEPRSF